MPSLLDIPREIRDTIIEIVLCSAELHLRTLLQHRKIESSYMTSSLAHGTMGRTITINRQLSTETQSALKRLSTKHCYSLDVMMVNEQELWPTWLSVPALSSRIDSVAATFRIFGSWDGESRSAFRISDGSPPQIVWCFYSLMERFLKRGPVGRRKPGSQDRNIVIKTLSLNVVTPPDTDMLAPQHVPYGAWYRSRRGFKVADDNDLSHSVMRPEWLASLLWDHIHSLLSMDYHMAEFGMIMYERIGAIRVYVDGELKREYDLGKMLADLRFSDPSETFGNVRSEKRIPVFWEWKKRALEKRREAGLPVIHPKNLELADSA